MSYEKEADSGFGKKFNVTAVKQVLDYLFGKQEEKDGSSKFLDMRTDISERELFNSLTYYRLLEEEYNCKAAGAIANILERLKISAQRMGRLEGVNILKQQMPKEETLIKGLAESLREVKTLE
jgi:hypothetical protein